jgi:hypothetical protein
LTNFSFETLNPPNGFWPNKILLLRSICTKTTRLHTSYPNKHNPAISADD